MTKLEEKVTDLITTEAIVASETEALATALAPYLAEIAEVTVRMEKAKETICPALKDTEAEVLALRKEILGLMQEKTHKFDFATVTRQVRRSLKVLDGNLLYENLRVMPAVLAKVTHSFTKCKIIDLVEAGALTLREEAEITETESLRVLVTKD